MRDKVSLDTDDRINIMLRGSQDAIMKWHYVELLAAASQWRSESGNASIRRFVDYNERRIYAKAASAAGMKIMRLTKQSRLASSNKASIYAGPA